MLTIRQYNKIMHDWIVLLTGLSGSNVRPQKNKFGFDLTDPSGKPIAFNGMVSMFYFGFEDEALDRTFGPNDSTTQLKRATLNVTFVGDGCDQMANQLQATAMGATSRNYLKENGFAILGNPNEIITDKEYSSKWFYRRTVQISLNCSLDFVPPQDSVLNQIIEEVPFEANAIQGLGQRPSDTIDITANGLYDVALFAQANVEVYPEGEIDITRNGDVDVRDYNIAHVNVMPENLQNKTVVPSSEEQVVTKDEGYDALGTVTVEPVPTEEGNFTANGDYVPSEGKFFGSVTVNVPEKGQYNITSTILEDGTQQLDIFDWDYVAFDPVFGNNTWEQIDNISREIASQGLTSAQVEQTYGWKLGDIKQETLTTGEVIELQIIGFNHDDLSDGTGKAGITLQMVNCLSTRYPMNSSSTNSGGWGASRMRTETLPTIKATLSQSLQGVIKLVDKKASKGIGTTVETLSDDLFLLAEKEIFGSVSYAQDGANEGTQYEYWVGKSANDRIKKYDTDADGVPDTATLWFERSSNAGNSTGFCYVSTNGSAYYTTATSSRGVAFALCI